MASEAYRRAYAAEKMSQAAIEVEASRLLANPKLTLRVSELQAKHAKRHDDHRRQHHRDAQRGPRPRPRKRAARSCRVGGMGLAKLHGLIIDRSKIDLTPHEEALEELRKLTGGGDGSPA